MAVHSLLINIEESAASQLTTIYIKYKIADEPLAGVFAVMWVKTAKAVFLGLATPEKVNHPDIVSAPRGMVYKGLTSYIKIREDSAIPTELERWARSAFQHVKNRPQ
jgi:hypothetical protein